MNKDLKKKRAFTLAEVLITLGIIGIVAAMTIPTLISNYKEKQTISKLQKTYALFKNAFEMGKIEHGDYSLWSWNHKPLTDCARVKYFWETYIFPHLKITKKCFPVTEECFPVNTAQTLNGRNDVFVKSNRGGFVLNDGTMIYTWAGGDAYQPHIWVVVDINGANKPNIIGKDIFYLRFSNITKKLTYETADENGEYQSTGEYIEPSGLNLYGEGMGFTKEELMASNIRVKDASGKTDASYAFCAKNKIGRSCGAVLKLNNWKVPIGYPVKF